MKCNCEENCIKHKEEVLKDITQRYLACPDCYTKTLKKAIPIKRQIKLTQLDKNYKKCESCGKRHMDIVMAHILKIMIEEKQISSSASIRKVGTPLITPAISLDRLPYLTDKSLVLITTTCDEKTAEKITKKIPEVKAVIKGNTDETVGKLTENTQTNSYEVLSGCDIRCDIQYTDTEPVILYKKQSKIHIEYPKVESPKINQLKEVLEKYENPKVLDAMCGPGTLGIYAKLKNAKFVHFNDIYLESIDSLKTNLKINEISEESYEITNENLLELPDVLDTHFDIGIVDAFPDVETFGYVESLNRICDEVIII